MPRTVRRLVRCLLPVSWLLAAIACGSGSGASSPTEPTPTPSAPPFIRVGGTLWNRCVVNATGPDFYSEPIAGVTVSTSLDAQTTTTDAAGRFTLETRTRPTAGQDPAYTLSFNGAGVSFSVSVTGTAIEGRNFSPNQCPVGS